MLAAIIDSSDDAIYSKDVEARVTSWNRSSRRLYGWEEDEVIGRDGAMIVPPDRRGEERMILRKGVPFRTRATFKDDRDHLGDASRWVYWKVTN